MAKNSTLAPFSDRKLPLTGTTIKLTWKKQPRPYDDKQIYVAEFDYDPTVKRFRQYLYMICLNDLGQWSLTVKDREDSDGAGGQYGVVHRTYHNSLQAAKRHASLI